MPLRHWLIIHLKKVFIGKEKEKKIMFCQFFFIFHKSGVKTFLIWIVNHCPKGTR